jgi:uncharacterized ferritin-like protein (DUF455 family)
MLAHFSPEDGLLLRVEETGTILRRYYQFKKAMFRAACGWFSRLPTFRLKYDVARHIYLDARGADMVGNRLRELMFGRGQFSEPASLTHFLEVMPRAQNAPEYFASMYLTLKANLVKAYREHLQRTDAVFDAPTIDVLEWLLRYDEEQVNWAKKELHQLFLNKEQKQQIARWQEYLEQTLAAAGGILGNDKRDETYFPPEEFEQRSSYELPWEMGFADMPRHSVESEPGTIPEDYHMVYAYFQEIDIADLLGLIIYESPESMPIAYYVDLCRQMWDEVRHTTMGLRRLQELGFSLTQCGAPVKRWGAWRKMSVVERFGWLTQVGEACSLEGKRDHIKKYLANNDVVSAAQIEYDIADESGHVRFGSKWIPELLKFYNDTRLKRQVAQDAKRSFSHLMAEILKENGKEIPADYLAEFQGCEDVRDPATSF